MELLDFSQSAFELMEVFVEAVLEKDDVVVNEAVFEDALVEKVVVGDEVVFAALVVDFEGEAIVVEAASVVLEGEEVVSEVVLELGGAAAAVLQDNAAALLDSLTVPVDMSAHLVVQYLHNMSLLYHTIVAGLLHNLATGHQHLVLQKSAYYNQLSD